MIANGLAAITTAAGSSSPTASHTTEGNVADARSAHARDRAPSSGYGGAGQFGGGRVDKVDIVVIGGGIAGSVVAGRLSAAGARVLVLEQSERFVDRVRGEY